MIKSQEIFASFYNSKFQTVQLFIYSAQPKNKWVLVTNSVVLIELLCAYLCYIIRR